MVLTVSTFTEPLNNHWEVDEIRFYRTRAGWGTIEIQYKPWTQLRPVEQGPTWS